MSCVFLTRLCMPALLYPHPSLICYNKEYAISSTSDTKNTDKPINKLLLVIWAGGLYSAATNYALSELIDRVLIHRRQRSVHVVQGVKR